jgi:hypothetical protein
LSANSHDSLLEALARRKAAGQQRDVPSSASSATPRRLSSSSTARGRMSLDTLATSASKLSPAVPRASVRGCSSSPSQGRWLSQRRHLAGHRQRRPARRRVGDRRGPQQGAHVAPVHTRQQRDGAVGRAMPRAFSSSCAASRNTRLSAAVKAP